MARDRKERLRPLLQDRTAPGGCTQVEGSFVHACFPRLFLAAAAAPTLWGFKPCKDRARTCFLSEVSSAESNPWNTAEIQQCWRDPAGGGTHRDNVGDRRELDVEPLFRVRALSTRLTFPKACRSFSQPSIPPSNPSSAFSPPDAAANQFSELSKRMRKDCLIDCHHPGWPEKAPRPGLCRRP